MSKTSKVIPGQELSLSSVKVLPALLNQFQKEAFHVITFQKLVNRAVYLYNSNPEFRKTILNCTDLLPSGSL